MLLKEYKRLLLTIYINRERYNLAVKVCASGIVVGSQPCLLIWHQYKLGPFFQNSKKLQSGHNLQPSQYIKMLDTVKNGKNAKNGKMQQLQDGFA
jgi:hypothetical protein